MSSLERRLAGGSSNKKISDASPQIEHHIQRVTAHRSGRTGGTSRTVETKVIDELID